MMRCGDCGSDEVTTAVKPQCLGPEWGPLGHLIFVPFQQVTVCPNCGEIGMVHFQMTRLCTIVDHRQRERKN